MTVPHNHFIIHQPKHQVPGVYDLHPRGMFRTRPFVTRDWGIRILADDALQLKVQYLVLADEPATDPATGEKYRVVLRSVLIDLDPDKGVAPEVLAQHVAREEARREIVNLVEEWRDAYLPRNDAGRIDATALEKKLTIAANEYKANQLKHLAQRNNPWIQPGLPRALQDFQRYLHPLVSNDLHACYTGLDGRDDEKQLVKKIALLQRVYTEAFDDPLRKPDGDAWKDEDEVWACWTGLAGSAEEARRIGRTLETVFRPVITRVKGAAAA